MIAKMLHASDDANYTILISYQINFYQIYSPAHHSIFHDDDDIGFYRGPYLRITMSNS